MDKKENKMLNLFGFEFKSFKSLNSLIDLMNRPEDPASLAIFRICFGLKNYTILFNQIIIEFLKVF